jgi:hopene-associated glycosyltransferase HpnB
MLLTALGVLSLLIWLYLVLGRGMFWLAAERDERKAPAAEPKAWPSVVAVVPARDEADVIGRSIAGLLAQDYPGEFRVILVDDQSSDGTADAASRAAEMLGASDRLEILSGRPLPKGWTGKLWALSQGVERAAERAPEFILLTDADIGHQPANLRGLVSRAEATGLALATQMVRLHCRTWPEKLLIPAFVFFFQMLFPFGWVNDPKNRLAAGAGGCMLVRRRALEAAGGIASVRGEIIDDCALGARLKAQGPIWLGLTIRAESLRPYETLDEIGRMVRRSAYAQLGYSPWALAGTILGMAITYLAPPLLTAFADGAPRWAGLAAWLLMALAFQPTLRLYRRSPLWGLALPLIGALYSLYTVQSALQVWQGKGGQWKGRAQAMARTST